MIALLDDAAVLHHQDHVGIADGGQPVCDHEAGAITAQPCHRLLHQQLGPGVDRAGRLVQDQQCRIGQERPSDGEQLLLTGGDVAAFLVDHRVITVGQRVHEAIDVGGLGCGVDLFLGCVRAPVGDVVPDGSVEQPGVLQHHPDLGAQGRSWHRRDVDTVHPDGAALQFVEPHDQVHQRGLAGTGRSDDRDSLARIDLERQVGDQSLVRVVAELDVVEDNPSPGRLHRTAQLRLLLLLVQHLEHPLGRSDTGLQQGGHRRQLGQRLGELPRILDERLHVTQTDLAVGHPQAAGDRDDHVVDVSDEHHHRHHRAGDELGAEAGPVELVVLLRELCLDLLRPAEDLDQ